MAAKTAPADAPPPLRPGLLPNLRFDLMSGFLVFLIAMPLCLGIATASKYPPVVGIWTAVIGGVLTCLVSNSQLTIKGPAAGMIVIVSGAVLDIGAELVPAIPESDAAAMTARLQAEGRPRPDIDRSLKDELVARQAAAGYPMALGIGVAAGIVQVLFGLLRAGRLGELVPLAPVHGLLAAIGITIMAKMLFPTIGLSAPAGAPVASIAAVPEGLTRLNPSVTAVGAVSLAVLVLFPLLKAGVRALKPVPAQVVVLAAAIPLGLVLGLRGLGEQAGDAMRFLVNVPNVLDNPAAAFAWPDFEMVATPTGIKYVALFALVGSIESLLSSQAIDILDPWRRKTDQNRDLLAVGLANTLCSAIGSLPMISEIVRSKANIDNGARTRYANLFHGLFLLVFVLLAPWLIRTIPVAALAAMLVYTGFRLASPREFVHAYRIGPDQLTVFVFTIVVTLCTDLLIGVVSGIALEVVFTLVNGAPVASLLRASVETGTDVEGRAVVRVKRAAVFSNWLGLRSAIEREGEGRDELAVDLSQVRFADHSTMEKLHELEREFAERGKRLWVTGLEGHTALSSHPAAARRNRSAGLPREVVDTAGMP